MDYFYLSFETRTLLSINSLKTILIGFSKKLFSMTLYTYTKVILNDTVQIYTIRKLNVLTLSETKIETKPNLILQRISFFTIKYLIFSWKEIDIFCNIREIQVGYSNGILYLSCVFFIVYSKAKLKEL